MREKAITMPPCLRDRAATQSGTGAARHHGNVLGGGQPHDLGNLLRSLREDNGAGRALADASVVLVEHEVFGTVQDGIASGDRAQKMDKTGQVHSQSVAPAANPSTT